MQKPGAEALAQKRSSTNALNEDKAKEAEVPLRELDRAKIRALRTQKRSAEEARLQEAGYINGKPAEVPRRSTKVRGKEGRSNRSRSRALLRRPDVRAVRHAAWEDDTSTGSPERSRQIHGGPEVHEATGTLHNGLRRPRQRSALPKSLPSSGRIWTCRGGSRERSSKSKPKRLHPGAKVWIQEVLLCQQWSAEDVIVGSINKRSADGSRDQ